MTDSPPALPFDPPARAPGYLDGLNAPQRQAVETLDGPVLVLAGAGTGKTRVLTTRLAHLIVTGRARPAQILAVTFTNKAAREMRERVGALLGRPTEGWWIGTFHALAARILRRHAEGVGLTPSFTILDTDDQLRLIKQLLEADGIDAKRWPARLILSVIERWKDRALTPARLKPEDGGDIAAGKMVALYAAYQARLKTLNACDFGDLLLHVLTLFEQVEETADGPRRPILEAWQDRFRYLLVDEYQDTNQAQYFWLRLLAQRHRNLACVGDDDQSIYSWRGAEIGNILRFESDFPGASVIRLEENYRSTGAILGAAAGLIARNQGRLGKTVFTAGAAGEPVSVHTVWDGEEEARWITDRIEALAARDVGYDEMAILVRAGFQMRELEDRLIQLNLPYRVIGGPRFYERREIRDALAYLRVLAQPADDLAFERIVNTPRRGIGATSLRVVADYARRHGVPLTAAVEALVATDDLPAKARASLARLMRDFARWRQQLSAMAHPDLVRIVLDESGYTAMWQADPSPDAAGRLDNLKELANALEEFETLPAFLEHVSLVMEAAETGPDGGRPMVSLMTLHGAKGLEFGHVFLAGWEEGVFPSQRSMDENGIAGLEEERRLAYVGLTRAKTQAYVATALRRRIHGNWQDMLPSRFLEELPGEHVVLSSDLGPGEGFSRRSGTGDDLGGSLGPAAARFETARRAAFRQQPAPVVEGVAYRVAARPSPAFDRGARVFHQKFGPGTVAAVDGDKLTIAFDHAGEKRVVAGFVVPLDQAG